MTMERPGWGGLSICMANALTRASEDRDNLTKELAGDE